MASGFLLKDVEPEQLLAGIRVIAHGGSLLSPSVTRRLIAEIAEQLVVSTTTVKTHVARVRIKLALRDRVQAVVLAYETGVIRPGTGR
jgi:DNA-binding NarL/FixJ family response regulator